MKIKVKKSSNNTLKERITPEGIRIKRSYKYYTKGKRKMTEANRSNDIEKGINENEEVNEKVNEENTSIIKSLSQSQEAIPPPPSPQISEKESVFPLGRAINDLKAQMKVEVSTTEKEKKENQKILKEKLENERLPKVGEDFWSCHEDEQEQSKRKLDQKDVPLSPLQEEQASEKAVATNLSTTSENGVKNNFSTDLFEERAKHNLRAIELQHQLDQHYDRAIEEREILWNARIISVKQCAFGSLLFFAVYLLMGTMFYDLHTYWTLSESLLFSIYSITTVGYGNHVIPESATVQIFTIFYIFTGISALTIVVAQAYQYISLEASRAKFRNSENEIKLRKQEQEIEDVTGNVPPPAPPTGNTVKEIIWEFNADLQTNNNVYWEKCVFIYNLTKHFLNTHFVGKRVKKMLPHLFLILLGAAVVGPIEGWSFSASIYWAVVTLTTVGYGDYFPSKVASRWFCIFYLPFSIGFMSLFLAEVAQFYIQLSNRNIQRIERKMRRQFALRREMEGKSTGASADEDEESIDDELSEYSQIPKRDVGLFGSRAAKAGIKRREQVMADFDPGTNQTMIDVLEVVRMSMESKKSTKTVKDDSNYDAEKKQEKPSFSLRLLVQERFAGIIANDIAGFQSNVDIKDNTLSVTIETLRITAEKWSIPARARKAFRSVAFEVLFFIGEHTLITRGTQALLDLSPIEFHKLFGPLLAAMGDKESMESWLAVTDVLADVELKRDYMGKFSNKRSNASPRLSGPSRLPELC